MHDTTTLNYDPNHGYFETIIKRLLTIKKFS